MAFRFWDPDSSLALVLEVFVKRWGGAEERYRRPVPLGPVSSALC